MAGEDDGIIDGIPTDVTTMEWIEAEADGEYPEVTVGVMKGDFQDVTITNGCQTISIAPSQFEAIARAYVKSLDITTEEITP